ncbi:MAG TPA: hypothetical protein VF861_02365, partial [Telluria sp.]
TGTPLGEITFAIGSRENQKGRTVCQQLWAREVTIKDGDKGRITVTCVVACVFHANWTPVPPQTGQSFQRKLDTCSMPNWTPVPRQTGHHGRDGSGLRCGFTPDGASLSN